MNPPDLPTAAKPWRSRFAKLHPHAYLSAHVIGGVVASVLILWAFGAIADAIPENGFLDTIDQLVTGWLHNHATSWGDAAYVDVSLLGSVIMALVLGIAITWYLVKRDRWRAILVATAGVGAVAIDTLLKMIFRRGRPQYAGQFIHHHSWSFPSGHAMESMAGYGILAYLLIAHVQGRVKRRLFVAATAILIALIGFSRVYLGVHYMSDVIGGWLAGGFWLLVCITGDHFARREIPAAAKPQAH